MLVFPVLHHVLSTQTNYRIPDGKELKRHLFLLHTHTPFFLHLPHQSTVRKLFTNTKPSLITVINTAIYSKPLFKVEMAPSNQAAYVTQYKPVPLKVKTAPYTRPGKDEIVVKNAAVAVNPIDWIFKEVGQMVYTWVKLPFVLGSDVAGEVVEVGPGVTRFAVGDRVVGHAVGQDQKRNRSAEGAFQSYSVLLTYMTSPIPDNLSYESASVIPLGASTAACGLFQKDHLGLQHPSVNPKPTGKTVIIWGGSTSVGCNAIQLAVAAGYEVFTTASPRNFELVKKLGATEVFDYNSRTVIRDVVSALKRKTVAGALSIGKGSGDICFEIISQCKGNKFVSMATYPLPDPLPTRFVALQVAYNFVPWMIKNWLRSKLKGVRTNFIFGTSLIHNDVGPAIYQEYLPEALAQDKFVAAPDPEVTGHGLEQIDEALKRQKGGVSAKKIVVTL